MLSGWCTSPSVLTGLSSPSTAIESDVTFVGSFLLNTIFQTRPFVDRPGPKNGAAAGAVPLPESTT